MMTARRVHASASVQIRDVRCRAPRGESSGEESSTGACLVLPLCGAFEWQVGRRKALLDCNAAALFSTDSRVISHPFGGGDRCVALQFADDLVFAAFGSERVTPRYWILDGATQRHVHSLLHKILPANDNVLLEETAIELLDLFATHPQTPAATSRHDDVVELVRAYINERLTESDNLKSIGAAVGYSAFHLARVFRSRTGTTIHQYRHAARLAWAHERLHDGDEPIADIAVDLGFYDHSHLAATFARQYGATPSSIRHRCDLKAPA
ncbi:MAG TPA: AraC family transcriptional regulator [Candidatus Binatus sp.]|nr:AraC family transcriptional regulator [Candidatus Binatus sp.]